MEAIIRRKEEESFIVQHQVGLHGQVTADCGLELEFEGNKFRKENLPSPWTFHEDHSLRGQDHAEYVFEKPQKFDDVDTAVDAIFADMKKFGTKLDDSNRTSVHVHLNVRNFFLNRLAALMSLWVLLEQPLVEWCGEHRVGNLFCLRSTDALGIVTHLRRFIRSNMIYGLREGLHYAGMNAHAVVSKGSLEFRTLQGTSDPEVIKTWVKILRRLYDLSGDYPDPRAICEGFSGQGAISFFDAMMGDMAEPVRRGISWSDEQLKDALFQGVRLSQDIAYAKDWGKFKPVELKVDVFGRTKGRKLPVSVNTLAQQFQELDEDMTEDELIEAANVVAQNIPPTAPTAPFNVNFNAFNTTWDLPEPN